MQQYSMCVRLAEKKKTGVSETVQGQGYKEELLNGLPCRILRDCVLDMKRYFKDIYRNNEFPYLHDVLGKSQKYDAHINELKSRASGEGVQQCTVQLLLFLWLKYPPPHHTTLTSVPTSL